MRFLVLIFLLIISVKTFAQKDSSANSIPFFYKNDHSLYIKGEMEIPATFLNSTIFFGNLTPVKIIDKEKNNLTKIGLVNRKGKFVVPAELDDLGEVSGRYMVVYRQSFAGLINDEGNLLIDFRYKSLKFLNSDTIRSKEFCTWKVRDASNNTIVEYLADSLRASGPLMYDLFKNGSKEILTHPKWSESIIEKEGQIQKTEYPAYDKFKFVKFKSKTGVENSECNLIIAPVFDSIHYISSDSIFMVYWKKKIGIMDKDGSELLPLGEKFQKIFNFNDGRAKVLKDGRYGFIDRIGNVHISPQYPDAHHFSENAVAVVIAGKWGFLDKDENIIVQPFYQEVRNFKYSTARVKEKGKWFFVNKVGKKITTTPYDDILSLENKKWLLVTKGKFGLADTSGKEMLAPKYEYLEDLDNGYVIVKKTNKWGVLDYNQNFFLPIEFDGLKYDKYNHHFLTAVNGKEELISLSNDKKRRKGK